MMLNPTPGFDGGAIAACSEGFSAATPLDAMAYGRIALAMQAVAPCI